MRLKLKPWNLPLDFVVGVDFNGIRLDLLGWGRDWSDSPPFLLVGAWKLEVQKRFNGIHPNLLGRGRDWSDSPPFQLAGAWKGLGN